MSGKKRRIDFDKTLQRLEDLVNAMEEGELSLEESLKAFEEGVKLTRECQKLLDDAEQRVNLLVAEEDQQELIPFEEDDD